MSGLVMLEATSCKSTLQYGPSHPNQGPANRLHSPTALEDDAIMFGGCSGDGQICKELPRRRASISCTLASAAELALKTQTLGLKGLKAGHIHILRAPQAGVIYIYTKVSRIEQISWSYGPTDAVM